MKKYEVRRVALYRETAVCLGDSELLPQGAELAYSVYMNLPNGMQSWVSDHPTHEKANLEAKRLSPNEKRANK
tara:strand:+ start:86 stop:304 length:219 start_codon:yes stop_codon:yes gene_type:complete